MKKTDDTDLGTALGAALVHEAKQLAQPKTYTANYTCKDGSWLGRIEELKLNARGDTLNEAKEYMYEGMAKALGITCSCVEVDAIDPDCFYCLGTGVQPGEWTTEDLVNGKPEITEEQLARITEAGKVAYFCAPCAMTYLATPSEILGFRCEKCQGEVHSKWELQKRAKRRAELANKHLKRIQGRRLNGAPVNRKERRIAASVSRKES